MGNLAVSSVADEDRGEQCRWLAHGESWQKLVEPAREPVGAERPAHTLCLHQCWRKKIVSAWLPGLTIGIVRVPGAHFFGDCSPQRIIADDLRILQC